MTVVERIVELAATEGLELSRCAPRGSDRLLVDFRTPRGEVVAGQWHTDPAQAAAVARRTADVADPGDVSVTGGHLVLQRRGADRKLPVLRELAHAPGAVLVSHRAERRGVVRLADGDYTKVVLPSKVGAVASATAPLPGLDLVLPTVIDVDAAHGTVTTQGLPGRTLAVRLADRSVSDGDIAAELFDVGVGLRSFHHAPWPQKPSRPHDAAAELDVTRDWLSRATAFGLLPREAWEPRLRSAAALLAGGSPTLVRVHRDLHDKQLVLAAGRPPGLLDLDLATSGEAALDLANLLAHLDLRQLQGRCDTPRARSCAEAFLAGYAPDRDTCTRIEGYRATTRCRLAAVYAFRNAPSSVLRWLLSAP